MIIGLTGGIGSGKSTVSHFLREKGYDVIDADAIGKEIVEPGSPVLQELTDAFGKDILFADGSLNRKLLADIVFPNPEKKQRMDQIMMDRICAIIVERAKASRTPLTFMDVPLLFEVGLDKEAEEVWVVTADTDIRIARIMKRDNTDPVRIRERMNHQMKDEEKVARADHVLDNSGSREELENNIEELLKLYE